MRHCQQPLARLRGARDPRTHGPRAGQDRHASRELRVGSACEQTEPLSEPGDWSLPGDSPRSCRHSTRRRCKTQHEGLGSRPEIQRAPAVREKVGLPRKPPALERGSQLCRQSATRGLKPCHFQKLLSPTRLCKAITKGRIHCFLSRR